MSVSRDIREDCMVCRVPAVVSTSLPSSSIILLIEEMEEWIGAIARSSDAERHSKYTISRFRPPD